MGLKGGISIDADSGPLGYVLWYYGSGSQDFFTFIQISSGHTVAALIGKFVFESWEEKRASKDIVSWEQGFEMLQAFSSGKIAQLVGCSKGEGGKPASKQAQPGFDFPKRCLWILTLWSSSIKFHPKLSGGINHVWLSKLFWHTVRKKLF